MGRIREAVRAVRAILEVMCAREAEALIKFEKHVEELENKYRLRLKLHAAEAMKPPAYELDPAALIYRWFLLTHNDDQEIPAKKSE